MYATGVKIPSGNRAPPPIASPITLASLPAARRAEVQ